jgi:hypothetical protein
MRFGFNSLYGEHLDSQPHIAPLSPDIFRIAIIDYDPNYWVVDSLVTRLGIRPLVCIYGKTTSPDPARYAGIAREVMRRQPNAVIQCLNEPNSPDYGPVPTSRVKELMKAVVDAVPPGTGVYGPAMNPLSGWEDYMIAAYNGVEGVKPSLHIYPRREINATVDGAFNVARPFGTPQVTECGTPRDSWPRQADATKKLYQRIKLRGAGTCIFHTNIEPRVVNDWEQRSRLWFLRRDGSRTGLFDAINALR